MVLSKVAVFFLFYKIVADVLRTDTVQRVQERFLRDAHQG